MRKIINLFLPSDISCDHLSAHGGQYQRRKFELIDTRKETATGRTGQNAVSSYRRCVSAALRIGPLQRHAARLHGKTVRRRQLLCVRHRQIKQSVPCLLCGHT